MLGWQVLDNQALSLHLRDPRCWPLQPADPPLRLSHPAPVLLPGAHCRETGKTASAAVHYLLDPMPSPCPGVTSCHSPTQPPTAAALPAPPPCRYDRCFEYYKQAQASYWTAEEVDLSQDMRDWRKLTEDERHFISYVSGPARQPPGSRRTLRVCCRTTQLLPVVAHAARHSQCAYQAGLLTAPLRARPPSSSAGAGLLCRI